MPLKPNQVYERENTIGTLTKYKKGTKDIAETFEGICVAQSALFCHNWSTDKKDLQSKPDYKRASLLQGKYDISGDDQDKKRLDLFKNLELEVKTRTDKQNLAEALSHLVANKGLYFLRYPGHAMAAVIETGAFHWFDPEEGLFKYPNVDGIKNKIRDQYQKDHGAKKWSLFLFKE